MKIKGIVLQAKPMTTKNGVLYMSIVLHDGTQKYSISVWNSSTKDIKVANCVLLTLKESEGFYSCSTKDIEHIPDIPELQKYLEKPISLEEWDKVINECTKLFKTVDSMTVELQIETVQALSVAVKGSYVNATAARSNHHAFIGGLLQHTYELLNMFVGIYRRLPYKVNPFVVTVSCIMHDWGKLLEYTKDFDYTSNFFLLGHPYLSAKAAYKFLTHNGVPEKVTQQVEHCCLSHHKRLEFGSPVVPATKEAFLVATLDELSGIGVQYNQETGTKACGTTIYNFNYE